MRCRPALGPPVRRTHCAPAARRRVRPPGELQRARLERGRGARARGPGRFDQLEHSKRVVSRRVSLRRGGSQLHVGIEQPLCKRFSLEREGGRHQCAQRIAGERCDTLRHARRHQFLRVLHIGRGEQLRSLAPRQAVLEQTRGAERQANRCAAVALESTRQVVHGRAQAACGEDHNGLASLRRRHGLCSAACERHDGDADQDAQDHFIAFGKKSCSPPIL